MNIRQLFRRRTATGPAVQPAHDTSDPYTLTITDRLDVLRPDGSTWDLCEGHDHERRTVAQVLDCLVWENLASIPPADLYGLQVEPLRIVLPGVEPVVAVFYGPDEDFSNGRTLDETGLPLCWRALAEAAGAPAADAAESIGCPSCQHPPPATTAPVIPAQPPAPAWEQDGHFQVGDTVQMPPADPFPAKVVWVEGDRVGIVTNPANGAQANASREQLRHVTGCEPCTTDAAVQDAAEEQRESAYWEQWPADHRELHDTVMEDMQLTAGSVPNLSVCGHPSNHTRYKFGPNTPVREWMRTEFDGHMVASESPSLALGRIWDPIDWLRIEREHDEDGLTITVPWEGMTWPTVRSAYALAREAGLDVALDVDLEMDPLDDGTVGVEASPTLMFVKGVVPDEVEEQINTILGRTPESYPHSRVLRPSYPDRPGIDYSAPYKHDTDDQTMWFWA
ncbi:hypothetical protein ACIBSR_38415 [Streptomyces sp. NPDC049936]|uniref:hypothetical protein n=1 Tax=Streptomyces sp. NPDC049936 TaxID=3365599 RepID=UPI0037B44718